VPSGLYPRTPEIRERMRQAHLGKGIGRKPFLGHRHSAETIERNRQAHLGRRLSPETRERQRQANLGRKFSPEAREKMRRAKVGNKYSLGRRLSPESIEKLRQARLRQSFPTKMTAIERLLRDEFRKRRLKFEMHKTMFGRFQPDFVFESARLVVQADGDYWHTLPGRIEADHAFNKAATSEGWNVWRFGEREIRMHAPVCARAVARFVRDH